MNAPSGELALVFTDIQGSTGLWERLGAAFGRALALHDEVIRSAILRFDGYEVKTEGDAFMVAFPDAERAVGFCLDAQLGLLRADWSAEVLAALPREDALFRGPRVRMGVYVGQPERRVDPLSGRMDYFGPAVNRAARIAAAGHGGQILVSGAVWAAVQARLPDAVGVALGEHRLRGLSNTELIVQVLPASLAARSFPPPRTEETRRTNLRAAAQPLIGRAEDLASLRGQLASGPRILTVVGPGGIGKSRLVLYYVEQWLAESEARSAWWVALDSCEDDGAALIAQALGVTLPPGCPPQEAQQTLAAALAHPGRVLRGPMLLVADGVDQAIAALGPLLSALVALTPGLTVLATSRERLRVAGEVPFELGPLSTVDAKALFVSRSSEPVSEDATLTAIVERLDGIPLAIELAARRLDMLDPEGLLSRLDRSLEVLTGGARDAAARQRTLRATIEWSWRLLQPHEQLALAFCAVFAGSFTPDAAEDVLLLPEDAPPVLDVLQDLRDKSLLRVVRCEEIRGERRLALYGSVRELALEKLERSGQRPLAEARYRARVLSALAPLAAPLISLHTQSAMRRLWVERDHLIAVHRAARQVDPCASVKAALALAPILGLRGSSGALMPILDSAVEEADDSLRPWVLLARGNANRDFGRLEEAKRDLTAALSAASGNVGDGTHTWSGDTPLSERDPRAECFARAAVGNLYLTRGQLHQADEVYRVAQRDAESLKEHGLRALILANRGAVAVHTGRYDEASALLTEALRLERSMGLARAEAVAVTNLATLYLFQRRPEAEALLHEAEAAHLALGDVSAAATTVTHIALLRFDAGNPAASVPLLEEALERFRSVGQRRGEGVTLAQLGRMDRLVGDDARAEARWIEALKLLTAVTAMRHLGYVEASLGALYADRGDTDRARPLIESGRARLEKVGDPLGVLTAEVCLAHLDRAQGLPEAAAARIAALSVGDPSPAERSVDLRVALAIWGRR